MTCKEAGKQGGRPTLLNPALERAICKLIEETACSVYAAALSLNVEWRTVYRWEQWGREGKQPYDSFCHAVMGARARAEVKLVRALHEAAKEENDTAARVKQWLLERRFPHDYGQRIKIEEQLANLSDTQIDAALEGARLRADPALGAGASETQVLPSDSGKPQRPDSVLPAGAVSEAADLS